MPSGLHGAACDTESQTALAGRGMCDVPQGSPHLAVFGREIKVFAGLAHCSMLAAKQTTDVTDAAAPNIAAA
eukprot:357846-Chlamydomonas_euryale.AAC.2